MFYYLKCRSQVRNLVRYWRFLTPEWKRHEDSALDCAINSLTYIQRENLFANLPCYSQDDGYFPLFFASKKSEPSISRFRLCWEMKMSPHGQTISVLRRLSLVFVHESLQQALSFIRSLFGGRIKKGPAGRLWDNPKVSKGTYSY